MNLLLHGVGPLRGEEAKPPITIGDSLASAGTTRYDVVLTNTPFGKKSSVLIVNEAGEQDRESLTIAREDFIATTSKAAQFRAAHQKRAQDRWPGGGRRAG